MATPRSRGSSSRPEADLKDQGARVEALAARPAVVAADPAALPPRPALPAHAQRSKRAIALHFCMLIVPSRHGQGATWPGSHGTGTGPSFSLSVSTIAEQPASSTSPAPKHNARWLSLARADLLPFQSPFMRRGWCHTLATQQSFEVGRRVLSRSMGHEKSKNQHRRSRQIAGQHIAIEGG